MPKRNGYLKPYRLATRGVDLYHSPVEIAPTRSPYTQNCFYRDGIVQRLGMSYLASTAESGGASAAAPQYIPYGGDILVWQGLWPG